MYSFEEFLEMSGAALFLYALVYYIEMKFKKLTFVLDANNEAIEN
jgi:hypothetical protein